MTNKKITKRPLVLSALSLLMCISMLIGSTFAWFTDSVSSVNNIIKSGSLDIDVYYGDAADENSIEDVDTLFSDVEFWEPGAVAYENLTVVNKGTLAFKYRMAIAFTNENHTVDGGYCLSQVLKVGVVEGGLEAGLTREEAIAKVSEWKTIKEFNLLDPLNGELLANTDTDTYTDNFALVIYWEPTAEDNNWNLNNGKEADDGLDYLHIDLGVSVIATQKMHEEDSFDETYDEGARFPVNYSTTLEEDINAFKAQVEIPSGSLEPASGEYTLDISGYSFENDKTDATFRFDMKLMDGDNEADAGVTEYPVEIQLPHPFVNMDEMKVLHNGEEIAATYNEASRTVSFVTDGFSPFEIKYVDYVDPSYELEYKTVNGQYVITKGMFFVDPVADFAAEDVLTIGNKTAVVDSDCITVDFEKEGAKSFVVSNRATSVFVAPDATSQYVAINGTFDSSNVDFRNNQSGKLYSVFSSLQTNDYNTVYLLPGTFNEGTTVNVVSSVDIIGLGDTNEVKVIKPAGTSKSNRHLFNCNGTKADYIKVTMRNMYLDVLGMNTANQDNAAVQSIRKTKVKCYDLTIVKNNPNNMGMIAFYVNGNNAVDGVKYPAYLYVEDCTLDTTKSFAVISTAGSYKFYHNGLTYGGTAYTTNSGSNKNIALAADDWDW